MNKVAVSIIEMRRLLFPGVWAFGRDKDPLEDLPLRFRHIHALKADGTIRTLGDLMGLQRCFTSLAGTVYEEKLVSAGFEYPQGWGRTRDPATGEIIYDEPNVRPDGKVEVFRKERNAALVELDEEISSYLNYRSGIV